MYEKIYYHIYVIIPYFHSYFFSFSIFGYLEFYFIDKLCETNVCKIYIVNFFLIIENNGISEELNSVAILTTQFKKYENKSKTMKNCEKNDFYI